MVARYVMLALWISLIWGQSMLSGDSSSGESLAFLSFVQPLLDLLHITDLDLVHLFIRKAAHFSEYFVLAVLAVRAFMPLWGTRKPTRLGIACTLAMWPIVPSIDETIQRFVPGRVGTPKDVAIDMCGYATALLVCWLVSRRAAKRAK